MLRQWRPGAAWLFVLTLLSSALAAGTALALEDRALVLPLRSIGVSDTTALVSGELLLGSLEDLGANVLRPDPALPSLATGLEACDAPACAAALARERDADLVVYGSLSRLGGKIIVRINVLRADEDAPWYRDQLTASSEDDLDAVMRRFAEGITAGRPNSDRATVESVTRAESETPARRATRSGMGVRAGFLFPTAGGFGGADRLTSLRAVYRYEFRNFQVETTPVLGFMWGKGNFDWSMLDLGVSRIFGTSDLSTYLGASVGVHSVTVERGQVVDSPYPPYSYDIGVKQTETAPTLSLVAGLMTLRTYDFVAVIELRYYHVLDRFERVGGDGAQGVLLTFGTSH